MQKTTRDVPRPRDPPLSPSLFLPQQEFTPTARRRREEQRAAFPHREMMYTRKSGAEGMGVGKNSVACGSRYESIYRDGCIGGSGMKLRCC